MDALAGSVASRRLGDVRRRAEAPGRGATLARRAASVAIRPTAHADVNALLERLLAGVQATLGPRMIAVYLDGSLAIGDFEPDRSDIDFVVVTDGELPAATVAALQAMHTGLAGAFPRWGVELEGSYISGHALGGHDPRPGRHPYIDRGSDTLELVRPETGYWVIHRHVLREHGVTLVGPAPPTLIDPVSPDELRRAVEGILAEWWAPMLSGSGPLWRSAFGYRCYAVLTMCRMLYTLAHGTVVTKPVAARWAEATLDPRWRSLIRCARAWSPGTPPDLDDTLAFVRYVCERR